LTSPRIIAGKAKGLRLKSVPGDITRPITDRVKESLFNILSDDIQGAALLDLFGGTGSVGIEALSRGAVGVRFVDVHRAAITTIKANLEHTKLGQAAEVVLSDAYALLRQRPNRQFDYVYIAPPQYKKMWQPAVQALDENTGWLAENAWVITQIDPKEYEKLTLQNLNEFDERKYGSTLLIFYEFNPASKTTGLT
jgi:16S rRNA (guanine966-N2)-methyltransferase